VVNPKAGAVFQLLIDWFLHVLINLSCCPFFQRFHQHEPLERKATHLKVQVSQQGQRWPFLFLFEFLFVSFGEIKRELNRRLIYEYRCDERLRAKAEGSTRLTYTGFRGGLEHLKIETRLRDERFESLKGECVI
jgi:hypothetical protein